MESSSPSISRQQQNDEKVENEQKFLPGFRFHPTEEELVGFYLRRRLRNHQTNFRSLIQDVDLYSHEPWDLPGLAAVGEAEREWFFFVSFAGRLHSDGRPNRITAMGYWKATGTDRPVYNHPPDCHPIGCKKTLVFYKGRAPGGDKTDWVMNEYRFHHNGDGDEKEEDIRLCRVYKKASLERSFDRRPTIHAERPLHTGHPSTFASSQIETNSSQKQCKGLGQQSMNESAGKPYSPPKAGMEGALEEFRPHNSHENVWGCSNALTLQDAEVEMCGSLSPLWHYSP